MPWAPCTLLPTCLHSSLQYPPLFWLSLTATVDTMLMGFSLGRTPAHSSAGPEARGAVGNMGMFSRRRATQSACRQQGWEVKLGSQASWHAAEPGRSGCHQEAVLRRVAATGCSGLELSYSEQWLQCWAEAPQWDGVMLCWKLFGLLFPGRGFPVQSRAGGHNQLLSLQLHRPKS